ncbi:hypothetical protein [Pseudomonas syringae group genomosp. 3]|uniref:Uncharacterized protein n=2 Tax=Pseudomonas syringae group genomosp. 3 TaxID=251701 RepID=Q87XX7_PSESM|nr:hypothetical protein [Pseudomonas syringae group genomosp. 3]AAO57504.1 protein of unknown function [Pseudomonas syringae pv. tomato str. DC3000]KKI25654.1 prophage PSSB64-02 [Pseudomonas syringae pv. persicae]KPY89606.1 putative prophage PSSB64-02, Orf16 [Pseudomonas syringae pv. tomato]
MKKSIAAASVITLLFSFSASAKPGQAEMEAAALMAFNAAEMCHNQHGLYLSAAEAHRNGHTDQKIKDVSGASPGSAAEAAINRALSDANTGSNTSDQMYDQCMKKSRDEVYRLIEGGKAA